MHTLSERPICSSSNRLFAVSSLLSKQHTAELLAAGSPQQPHRTATGSASTAYISHGHPQPHSSLMDAHPALKSAKEPAQRSRHGAGNPGLCSTAVPHRGPRWLQRPMPTESPKPWDGTQAAHRAQQGLPPGQAAGRALPHG